MEVETGDDAGVCALDNGTCVIATTDFFMPMVDDPLDFGRIAASVALSDIYAMGGTPIMALAILGMPVDKTLPGPCAQNPRRRRVDLGSGESGMTTGDRNAGLIAVSAVG